MDRGETMSDTGTSRVDNAGHWGIKGGQRVDNAGHGRSPERQCLTNGDDGKLGECKENNVNAKSSKIASVGVPIGDRGVTSLTATIAPP